MVNPGHPSKGCTTCKLRKIQCDLTRPVCRHCTKSRRVCLGYGERPTVHPSRPATEQQQILSCSSEAPGQMETPPNIESSVAAISFLEDLLLDSKRTSQDPGSRYSFDTMIPPGPTSVVTSATITIRRCLHALQQSEQSFQNRRNLLAEYSTTLSKLRETLTVSPYSPALASAVFLFSIYEMIVNIDPKDRTWQIHLEGLLNILSQRTFNHQDIPTSDFDTLHRAIIISKSEGDVFQKLASYNVNDRAKAFLILDVATLCLRPLTVEAEGLFRGNTPRKLDVQKLRASVKHVQKNLKLFPKICSRAELDTMKVPLNERLINAFLLLRWNDYHCLQLITADLLLSTGNFIHSGEAYDETRESIILSSIIQDAGESICSAIPVMLETIPIQEIDQSSEGTHAPIGGFLVFWSLCCALKSKTLHSQQRWLQDTLWSIGTNAFIPHASALARSKAGTTKWTDVVAGLLLKRVALSQEMRGFFHQNARWGI